VAPEARTGERYANQVGELWNGLARTLVRLEALAGAPELLDDGDAVDELRGLQYRLHVASEYTFGLAPPAGAEQAHRELASALGGARDATGEIIDAAEMAGLDAVETIVYEWRGALFRVRLARLRLSGPRQAARQVDQEWPKGPKLAPPLAASVLAVAGATAFAVGAIVGSWPVWGGGLLAFCGSFLVYRP
jgi:hypothetical protein